jgi:DNA-binding transcriptional LysR family regulator
MKTDLNHLHAFIRVARERSFRKAALQLGVTSSALSHTVARLEEDLGVRLLNRTTRSVAPTPAGARLLAQLEPALDGIGTALEDLHLERGSVRGRLRLNVPRAAAQLVLAPRLAQWTRAYPEVTLEVVSNDAVVDIIEQGFDAGMRFGELLQPHMVAVPVGPPLGFVTCAAPAYLKRHGRPRTPDDLLRHQCLQLRFPSGALYRWEYRKDRQPLKIATRGALELDDLHALLQAAVDGAGICYTYEALAAPLLKAGHLQSVLQAWAPPKERIYLYYPSRRNMSAALRALIDFLKCEGAQPDPEPQSGIQVSA